MMILSSTIEFISNKKAVKWEYDKENKKIIFSEETGFELYDNFGIVIDKGCVTEFDCSKLPTGKYYFNFDNKTGEFEIKEN